MDPERPAKEREKRVTPSRKKTGAMRVFGVDPGIAHTGYGVVAVDERGRLAHLASGTISTSSTAPFSDRLAQIHQELDTLFKEFRPEHMAVEDVFFSRNVRSALKLGQARGAALLSASLANIQVFEYAATEAKKAVCSYGAAGKDQVNAMVKALLGLKHDLPDHASDALALCICHVNSYRTLQAKERSSSGRKRGDPANRKKPNPRRKQAS